MDGIGSSRGATIVGGLSIVLKSNDDPDPKRRDDRAGGLLDDALDGRFLPSRYVPLPIPFQLPHR